MNSTGIAFILAALTACGDIPDRALMAEDGRNNVRIVGSSTVYPFAAKTAQEFRYKTGAAVIVEATGSGGGQKLFCSGASLSTPDVVTSSRRQKPIEAAECAAVLSQPAFEIQLGLDGIVLGQLTGQPSFDVSLREIYLALAATVPTSMTDCSPKPNKAQTWNEVDPALPNRPINVFGPPPTSGTRDSFVELVMQAGARQIECLAELSETDPERFRERAEVIREDGRWIDAGENDNTIIQTLLSRPNAIGIFGYSFLTENRSQISALSINGILPDRRTIQSGAYAVSRPLFVYVKTDHLTRVAPLGPFIVELMSEEAIGADGYLVDLGLVPVSDNDAQASRDAFAKVLSRAGVVE